MEKDFNTYNATLRIPNHIVTKVEFVGEISTKVSPQRIKHSGLDINMEIKDEVPKVIYDNGKDRIVVTKEVLIASLAAMVEEYSKAGLTLSAMFNDKAFRLADLLGTVTYTVGTAPASTAAIIR